MAGGIGRAISPVRSRLTPEQARDAWSQAVQGMADLLRLGYAHGDYSTYNLLWWENTVTIIDFPQLVTRQNPNFQSLLRRDVQSLVTSFRRHGVWRRRRRQRTFG